MILLAQTDLDPAGAFPAAAIAVAALLVWLAGRPVRPRPLVGPPRPPRSWRLRPGRWLGRDWPAEVGTPPLVHRSVLRQAPLDAGRGLQGAGRPAMPAPSRPLSQRYHDYIAGHLDGDSGDWGGWRWPEKRRTILAWWAARYGDRCLLGIVCGGAAKATQLDHCGKAAGDASDYSELFRETPRTCRPVCKECHVRRTTMQRQGVDAWAWSVSWPRGGRRG